MNLYHSHLLINVGENPDRPDWSIGRKWLRNLYRVHQRLCMAFPSKPVPADRVSRAALYCEAVSGPVSPLQQDLPGPPDAHGPDEDGNGSVHQPRSEQANFLFRIDYFVDARRGSRRPVIIVQSAGGAAPDWDLAFGLNPDQRDAQGRPIGNAGYLLAGPPQRCQVTMELDGLTLVLDRPEYRGPKPQTHRIRPGDLVRFRLRANPTEKRDDKRKRIDPRPGFMAESHSTWIRGKLGEASCSPVCLENLVPGWAYGWRSKHEPQPDQRMQFWSVLFEGTFRVGDTTELRELLLRGIGPAKAFGFGLLSLAPA